MEYRLNTLQKLDLYQVIAYAKEGDSAKIVERVEAMLKSAGDSPIELTDAQRESLVTLSVEEILRAALKTAA